MNKFLIVVILFFAVTNAGILKYCEKIRQEKEKYEQNSHALLSEVKRMQIDLTTTALDVKVLRLSLDEYEQYRAEDAEKIKQMGIKLKNLESVGKHELEVNVDFSTSLKDSIIIRDAIPVKIQKVQVNTPYLYIDGTIDENKITGNIKLPITLRQAISLEYKHKFLWWQWKVKAVHQTISSDNPHAQIKYSEMIMID